MDDNNDQSFVEWLEETREKRGDYNNNLTEFTNSKYIRNLVEGAKSETVTANRLLGEEQYFHQVLSYLEEDEQPHFLFPLTTGLLAESPLVVESGAEREELLGKADGGTCSITDRYVRIVSKKGEWTIPYNSVVSVDFVGHPALHVQTSGRTYYIKIAGTFFDEEEDLSEAATYIRERQREAASNTSDSEEDPLDKLEKLGELREKGVISEEEFENKKQELLEDI